MPKYSAIFLAKIRSSEDTSSLHSSDDASSSVESANATFAQFFCDMILRRNHPDQMVSSAIL